MASASQQPEPTLRSLGLSVYLPTLLFSVGQGAVIPIVALAARDLGASPAVAGLGVAVAGSAGLFAVVREGDEGPGRGRHEPVPFGRIVRDHKRVFLTAGVGSTAIGTLRASRQAVVPLWADHVGLGASATSVVYG